MDFPSCRSRKLLHTARPYLRRLGGHQVLLAGPERLSRKSSMVKVFAASIFVVAVDWLFERRGGQGRELAFIF